MSEVALHYLKAIGQAGDGPHDIARVAAMLASLDHPTLPLEPTLIHLDEMADATRNVAFRRVEEGAQLLALLMAERYGYDGDRLDYDNPKNADLIEVIARRRGLPVSLGILYMHAARAAGMRAEGLDTQGHFLIRLTYRHDDVTVDPFNGGAVLDLETAPTVLRDAGLAEPVSDIDVLLRLLNNPKMRALKRGDTARCLELTERMALIAPRRPELWFDIARLREVQGALGSARTAYETSLGLARSGDPLHNQVALALADLKRRLN
jgi:regulator of sirC expression with transglutaminase-like and TPR domain